MNPRMLALFAASTGPDRQLAAGEEAFVPSASVGDQDRDRACAVVGWHVVRSTSRRPDRRRRHASCWP